MVKHAQCIITRAGARHELAAKFKAALSWAVLRVHTANLQVCDIPPSVHLVRCVIS